VLPQTPCCLKGGGGAGDENEREVKRKGITGSKEKKEIKGKGETWNNGVFVPYCGSALLATI